MKPYLILSAFLISCSPSPRLEKIEAPAPEAQVTVNKEPQVTGDAEFSQLLGLVQHKRKSELVWEKSLKQTPLFIKDWVKTAENSSAEIFFDETRRVSMGEKSILVLLDQEISNQRDRAVIGVSQGEVRGEVGFSEKPTEILFKLPFAWVKVTSTFKQGVKKIFRMSMTDDRVKVQAVQGDVELVWKGENQILSEKEIFETPRDKSKEIELENNASEPPARVELKQEASAAEKVAVNKSTEIKKDKSVSQFTFLQPKNGYKTKQDKQTIVAKVPVGAKVFFRGQRVRHADLKLQYQVTLEMGLNILTFQVEYQGQTTYHSIEVNRQ